MVEGTGMKNVSRNTPVVEILKRILESREGSVSIGDLTQLLRDAWGRSFPENPYADYCLVYKLAVKVLKCKATYEDVPDGLAPAIDRPNPAEEPVSLHQDMSPDDINMLEDLVELVHVSLPKVNTNKSTWPVRCKKA